MLAHSGFEDGGLEFFDSLTGTVTINNTVPRNGAYCLSCDGSASAVKLITTGDEFYVRCGIRAEAALNQPGAGIYFYEGSTLQAYLSFVPTGTIGAYRGNSTLLTEAGAWAINTWYLVEIHLKVADAPNGIFQVKINGTQIIDFSGDTRNAGTAGTPDRIHLIGNANGFEAWYDDFAICNPLGAKNNTWLGNGYGLWLQPSAAGDITQLTPSAGANWDCVDEVPQNEMTDYVYSSVVDEYDLYNLEDTGLAVADVINCVTIVAKARTNTPGSANAAMVVKTGGVETTGSDVALPSDSWKYVPYLLETTPAGPVWSQALLDAVQVGPKVR